MRLTSALTVLLATTASSLSFAEVSEYSRDAFDKVRRSLPTLVSRDGNCPAFYTQLAADLSAMYIGGDGQCNDDARAAIREAFHDCGTWDKSQGNTGGCDGSLINTLGQSGQNEELSRGENNGLLDISLKLKNLAASPKYAGKISNADMIVFSAAVAIVSCPGGPRMKTFVGRKDSSNPAPGGFLPDVQASGDSLFTLFSNKGFSAKELAALLGAHTTSKAFNQAPVVPAGSSQDSTPGLWDVKYYAETLNPPKSIGVFPSDKNLAKHPVVGKEFSGFVGNQGKWTGAFADA